MFTGLPVIGVKGDNFTMVPIKRLIVVTIALVSICQQGFPQYADIFGSVDYYHAKVMDPENHLDSWHKDANGPFEYIIGLNAGWWKNAPYVNGWPIWCTAAEVTPLYEQSTGAIPGSACYFAIMACLRYYWYTGDPAFLTLAENTGKYIVEHDLTSGSFNKYPVFPYAVGVTGDINPLGYGHPGISSPMNPIYGVMPDKGAMIGLALLELYKISGEAIYLTTSINIANRLSDNAVTGTATNSPWPFRVMADDGSTFDGVFAGNASFACRLFDELLKIGQPGNGKFKTTRDAVWKWLKEQVIAYDDGSKWMHFFEDVSGATPNSTQIDAMETVRYLLENKNDADPDWFALAGKIINQVTRRWSVSDYENDGYISIAEQDEDFKPYPSHSARYGSILAMYTEAGAATAFADTAYHSLCYSTYSVEDNGFTSTFYNYNTMAWTTDSFGDFLYHFLVAMAAQPDWAGNDNHLLKSSEVIKSVSYSDMSVFYTTFNKPGTDKLKLIKEPVAVKIDGKITGSYTWDNNSRVLLLDRSAGDSVEIDLDKSITVQPSSLTLYAGGTSSTVSAYLIPDNQQDVNILWTSDATEVATVSQAGVVKPLSVGSALITATTGDGSRSSSCRVLVIITPLPQKPVLSSPYNDLPVLSLTVPLRWNSVATALSYELQVSLDPFFSACLVDNQNITNSSFTLNDLIDKTMYYWRVRARNSNGTGQWSDIWRFETGLITGSETGIKDSGYGIRQNYPNPFSEFTNIEYSLVSPGHAEISVFDALGAKICILTDEWLEPGNYSLQWTPPESLKSGLYYCRFNINNTRGTRIMIYIKP
jgi:hypothetical protein